MKRRHFIIAGLAAAPSVRANTAFPWVRSSPTPDRRGEFVTREQFWNGIRPNAPIPPEFHMQNQGGSDGAGLCVIASLIINGASQGIADFHLKERCKLWRIARSRPGGYSPQKLKKLLNEAYPELEWVSIVTDDPNMIRKFNALGYPIANTMNTGQQYSYIPIHHFVSTAHADWKMTCFVDNNDPGKYHWIPAAEQDRRFIDGREGWLFYWPYRNQSFGRYAIYGLLMVWVGLLWLPFPNRNTTS